VKSRLIHPVMDCYSCMPKVSTFWPKESACLRVGIKKSVIYITDSSPGFSLSCPRQSPDLPATTVRKDYSGTCMGVSGSGLKIVYRLIVTEPTVLNVFVDPDDTAYTGVGEVGNSADPYQTGCTEFQPGEYSVMVDTWPNPLCISNFSIAFYPCE
jgi:hypothetical protein